MIWTNKREVNSFWWYMIQGYPFLVFDVETTGLKKTDRIVQFSADLYEFVDGEYKCTKQYNQYIKPPIYMPPEVVEIHNITNEFLEDKPMEGDVFQEIKELFEIPNVVVAGYNVKFDIKMTNAMFERMGESFVPERVIDAYKIASSLFTKEELGGNVKLISVATKLGYANGVKFHSADADILATWLCMLKMKEIHCTTPVVPQESKELADILSMTRFQKGKTVNRIYIAIKTQAGRYGNIYYDLWHKHWQDGKESDIVQYVNMDELELATVNLLQTLGCKKYADFKDSWKRN